MNPFSLWSKSGRRFAGLALAAVVTVLAGLAAEPPELTFDPPASASEGWLILEWVPAGAEVDWEPGGRLTYELEQAGSPSFEDGFIRYRGPDAATFVSGLAEGKHAFRVRARVGDAAGPWSSPRVVEVDYVSRRHVILLMVLGAGVFVATAATIVRGHRRYSRRELEDTGGRS